MLSFWKRKKNHPELEFLENRVTLSREFCMRGYQLVFRVEGFGRYIHVQRSLRRFEKKKSDYENIIHHLCFGI